MKILIVSQEIAIDQPGGSGRVAWEQARGLAQAGHTVVLCAPMPRKGLKKTQKRDGVTIFRYGNVKRRGVLGRSFADIVDTPAFIKKTLAGAKYDKIIAHHPHVAYGLLRVSAARAIPLLYVFHASAAAEIRYEGLSRKSLSKWNEWLLRPVYVRWTAWIERSVLKRARAVAVFSHFSAKLLEDLYGRSVKGKTVTRLAMGVDMKRFSAAKSKNAVRKKLKIDQNKLVFLSVRRLVPRTGVHVLIESFRIAYDRLGEDIELVIVGEGREQKRLESLSRSIGLRKVVRFVGRSSDEQLPLWYQAADVHVIPTVAYEGFGVSTIESMSSGVPVIGVPTGAIPEVLLSFDERLLADAAKPLPLAERLVWFAEEGVAEKWPDRCRAFVKRFYSWSKHTAQVEGVLKEIK